LEEGRATIDNGVSLLESVGLRAEHIER